MFLQEDNIMLTGYFTSLPFILFSSCGLQLPPCQYVLRYMDARPAELVRATHLPLGVLWFVITVVVLERLCAKKERGSPSPSSNVIARC